MEWIEKQRHIIDFALSSLLRRWRKNTALFTLYTLIVFILASVVFFTEAIRREASLVLTGSPEVIVQRLVAGRQDLVPEGHLRMIRGIMGTSDARGRLWGYYFEPAVSANYTLVSTEEAGRHPGTVAIGQGVSRTLAANRGDMIPFKAHDGTYVTFEVRELLPAESELVSSDLIEIAEEDFRALFGIPAGHYTDLTLRVRNPRETTVVADKIRRLLPDTRPILREEILRTYDALFYWRSGLVLVIFLGAVLAFTIFAWDKATSLSMEEKKEIGILKAVGWETSEVILLKTWEGIIISLSAFLAGIAAAYVHVFFAAASVFSPVLKGWSVLYPDFRLIPFVDPYQVAALFFLSVVPYTMATIIPCWSSATIDPDSVMRL
jgi:ABC-type lipoprotein release transport system permease subunit